MVRALLRASRIRVIGMAVTLGALAAALLGGASAQAVPSNDHASCAFQGLTGNLDPAIPAIPGGNGQTGTYSFQTSSGSQSTCAIVDRDGGNTGTAVVSIKSTGRYTNQQCGTGTARGDSTIPNTGIN